MNTQPATTTPVTLQDRLSEFTNDELWLEINRRHREAKQVKLVPIRGGIFWDTAGNFELKNEDQ